jgi:hypothetical protein
VQVNACAAAGVVSAALVALAGKRVTTGTSLTNIVCRQLCTSLLVVTLRNCSDWV